MQYPKIFFLFFLVSCGGGGGDLEVNSNNSNPISGYKYVPPSGTSNDNCVARTSNVIWSEDFDNNNLDSSKWVYDEGCNDMVEDVMVIMNCKTIHLMIQITYL